MPYKHSHKICPTGRKCQTAYDYCKTLYIAVWLAVLYIKQEASDAGVCGHESTYARATPVPM